MILVFQRPFSSINNLSNIFRSQSDLVLQLTYFLSHCSKFASYEAVFSEVFFCKTIVSGSRIAKNITKFRKKFQFLTKFCLCLFLTKFCLCLFVSIYNCYHILRFLRTHLPLKSIIVSINMNF